MHIFFTIHTKHVSFRTSEGATGSNPHDGTHGDAQAQIGAILAAREGATFEIRDDRKA